MQAGQKAIFLHGCTGQGCTKVWGEEDADDVCNLCGTRRYQENGQPKEYIVHFPLRERFESWLSCPQYYEQVRWECDRTKTNPDYMTGMCVMCV